MADACTTGALRFGFLLISRVPHSHTELRATISVCCWIMLHKIKELRGRRLSAKDGEIGHVKDFYFDDKTWAVRYLVVDTGTWLNERLVLLVPPALGNFDDDVLRVKLTREQIEKSPPVDAHKPVSRQYEIEYHEYYGWPAYWEGGALGSMTGFPVVAPLPVHRIDEGPAPRAKHLDHHLQSAQSIEGYQIEAADGTLGHVKDFLFNAKDWVIHELVVATGHWFSGKEILISPRDVERLSYPESKVFVRLTRNAIEQAPEYRESAGQVVRH